MNAFNLSWTSALSMTLIHSLWQGSLITLLTWMTLRIFHSRSSNTKYLITTIALFLLFASSAITFFMMYTPVPESSTLIFSGLFRQDQMIQQTASASYLDLALDFLQRNQSWIVMGWLVGVFLFSLRFVVGITYLNYLRHRAVAVDDEWNKVIDRLSRKLKLKGIIALCESVSVQTPIVAGYLKPIVLMPLGLLSGLSMQQVEVVLIHELAHIKRHDYLINFIQSLGETVFFFNPFVWMLSAWIRDERENCCDDIVLSEGYSPHLYAKTLFELETSREETGRLALALTGNKNQLLNRIKRIMERTTKNQNGKEKFIPVILVMLGLVFASWLSITPNEEMDSMQDSTKHQLASDTTKKPNVVIYSRKSVTTYDEKGTPHEEVTESYEGDDVLIQEIAPIPDFDFNFEIPEVNEIPELAMFPPGVPPTMDFSFDTLFPGGFRGMEEDQMKEFQQKFQQEFKARFGDFYSKNQKELEQMMADAQKKMSEQDMEWARQMEVQAGDEMKRMEAEIAQIAPIATQAGEDMLLANKKMKEAEIMMRLRNQDMHIAEKQMRFSEDYAKMMEKNSEAFQIEVKKELISDGYLKPDEKLTDIQYDPSGNIKANGHLLKEAHKKKYIDLHKKYFNHKKVQRSE